MPFISEDKRMDLAAGGNPEQVGDLCYLFYRKMVKTFHVEPRWTTIHRIAQTYKYEVIPMYDKYANDKMINLDDFKVAADLAWDVFWQFYAIPYEIKKREENGDVF